MLNKDDVRDLLARARMHEQLAGTTDDPAARQMNRAMAEEYRRRADEAESEIIGEASSSRSIEQMRAD